MSKRGAIIHNDTHIHIPPCTAITYLKCNPCAACGTMSLSTEDNFLLCCARTTVDEETVQKMKQLLSSPFDWEYFIRAAERHKVSSLLYQNMKVLGKEVPDNVRAHLKNRHLEVVARTMVLSHELGTILKIFNGKGIKVICLKGVCLGEIVYKDMGMRSFNDIDVLVKKEDIPLAKELLAHTYKLLDYYPTKWHEKWWTGLCEDAQIRFANVDRKIMIEVHWDIQSLSTPFTIDIKDFWMCAQPVTIALVDTLMFSPENLVQHLCVHMDKHIQKNAFRLKMCCDIAEVIRHYREEIDWEKLLQSSQQYGIGSVLYRGLYWAATYLQAPVPDRVFHRFEQGIDSPSRVVFETMFRNSLGDAKSHREEFLRIRMLKNVDGIGDKIHIFLGEIIPTKEFMIRRYAIKKRSRWALFHCYVLWFGAFLLSRVRVLGEMLDASGR
jgi:hypothetical protein